MARRAAAVVGLGAFVVLTAAPVAAQDCAGSACRAAPEPVVVVESPIDSVVRSEGVFREGDEAGSLAASGAVAGGLLVVGCTLAGIARRRLLDVAPAPRPTTTTTAATRAASQWDPRVIERRAAGFLREPAQHI